MVNHIYLKVSVGGLTSLYDILISDPQIIDLNI